MQKQQKNQQLCSLCKRQRTMRQDSDHHIYYHPIYTCMQASVIVINIKIIVRTLFLVFFLLIDNWSEKPLAPPAKDVKLGWKSRQTSLCDPSWVSRIEKKSSAVSNQFFYAKKALLACSSFEERGLFPGLVGRIFHVSIELFSRQVRPIASNISIKHNETEM